MGGYRGVRGLHGSALDARLFRGPGAARYDRWTRILLKPVFGRIARDVAQHVMTIPAPDGRPLRLVDLGAGPGHLIVEIARRLSHAGRVEVLGVDRSPDMVARARRNAARISVADRAVTMRFECADVAALTLPDATVDLAVSTFSVHHWSDLRGPMLELARVLRPGAAAWLYDVWDVRYGEAALLDALAGTRLAPAGIERDSLRVFGVPLVNRLALRRRP